MAQELTSAELNRGQNMTDRREEEMSQPASGTEVKVGKSNPKLPKTGREYRKLDNNENTLPEKSSDKADLNGYDVIMPKGGNDRG